METFDKVYPQYPICKNKQIGASDANRPELAQEQEQEQIHHHTIDEDVVFLANRAQFIHITKQQHTRQQSFNISYTQD